MSQIYAGIDGVIPASFVLNEAAAGSQVMAQLEQVKQIIGYINTAYKILIAAAILLVLLTALVHWWQPKPITRSIGITFILVGVACILGPLLDYLIVQLLSQIMGSSGAMSEFQLKLPQLAADITAPLRTYGIGFLISGIALTVISFLFRSKQVSSDNLRS
jgi:predicted PurR-regulated permease PerM